jgi:ElaB/YqjD/DUF883 family membrane-anchored ribosome-binding protein
MNTNPSSGQTSRSVSGVSSKPADATPSHVPSQDGGEDDLSANVNKLRRDMAGLKDTLAGLVSQTAGEAAKTVRSVGQTMASQVSSAASGAADTGSDLASTAKEHAKTFASELEAMARRNPLGTIAGALVIGVVIGMMSRGRG